MKRMRTFIENASADDVRKLLESLPYGAVISDGKDIISADEISIDSADELQIAADCRAITIKRNGSSFSVEEDTGDEVSDDEYGYSPYSDGDSDPSRSFCDITPDGARLDDLLNMTVGDIIHIRKEEAARKLNASEEDERTLVMQRIPSALFEALDITRAVYSDDGRLTDASIMMRLKQDLTDDDRNSILTILSNAVTDILETPGDTDENGAFTWIAPHFMIQAHILRIKEREFAALSFHRE